MAQFFQITANEILSGICKAIYDVYGSTISIYKEKQEYIELPGVCVYCINYDKSMGRNDRYTNTFNIIINYFPDNTDIINNKRPEMFSEAEKLIEAIKYIELPAYRKDTNGQLVQYSLKNRAQDLSVEQQEGFIQISATYIVRTGECKDKTIKMEQLSIEVTKKI